MTRLQFRKASDGRRPDKGGVPAQLAPSVPVSGVEVQRFAVVAYDGCVAEPLAVARRPGEAGAQPAARRVARARAAGRVLLLSSDAWVDGGSSKREGLPSILANNEYLYFDPKYS